MLLLRCRKVNGRPEQKHMKNQKLFLRILFSFYSILLTYFVERTPNELIFSSFVGVDAFSTTPLNLQQQPRHEQENQRSTTFHTVATSLADSRLKYERRIRKQKTQQNHVTSSLQIRFASSAASAASAPSSSPTKKQQYSNHDDDDEVQYLPNDPNAIHPKTKPIAKSFHFFVRFVITQFWKNRKQQNIEKKKLTKIESVDNWRTTFRRLNEQRRNLVTLADYTASIVTPSFTFLLLGALMTSVVPHYWAKCLQLVATVGTNTSAGNTVSNMIYAVTGLLVTSTAAALLTGLRGSLFWMAGSRANYNVRVKLHRTMLLQEAAFFDSNETGYLLSRLNNDVNKIGQVISYHINVVCRQLAQFLFGSVYMIRISPMLSLYAMVGILVVAVISAIYGDFNRELAQRVQDTFADATAVSETSLSMSETIRAFDGVEIESGKYEKAQSRALELEEVQAWGYGLHKFVSDTVQEGLQVFLLVMCWYAGRHPTLAIPAEKLTTFLFYANFVLESSNEVGDQWAKIQGAVGASKSVFDLIRRVPSVQEPVRKTNDRVQQLHQQKHVTNIENNVHSNEENGSNQIGREQKSHAIDTNNGLVMTPSIVNGERTNEFTTTIASDTNKISQTPIISFQNMTVQYDSMDVPALNQVYLNIYHGDRVAIVGRSGSGKSSMLRAILRFYDPQSGSVSLNGKSLKNMTRTEIAQAVSIVEQQPSLFPMTLLENVLYGIPKDSIDPVSGEPCYSESWRATAAGALLEAGLPICSDTAPDNDDFGAGTTNNDVKDAAASLFLDTRVGEGGRSLSGGQKSRVAIARALIRDPHVILLDEPTAALDSESETKVVIALKNALKSSGDCMVMVTHRLNVIRSLDVNRVIVMDQGSIVEAGNPEDLLRNKPNGWYARLAREQGIVTYDNR